jgi:hypothetical protein
MKLEGKEKSCIDRTVQKITKFPSLRAANVIMQSIYTVHYFCNIFQMYQNNNKNKYTMYVVGDHYRRMCSLCLA